MPKHTTVGVKYILPPKPVHPRAIRFHGHFGMPFMKQHMVVDKRWTQGSLSDEFKNMTDLLVRNLAFKQVETWGDHKSVVSNYRNLRLQCREGRHKLFMSLYGHNTDKIRNLLINHKEMQRLYQKMPLHMVEDNVDQRTFVLRKERDFLMYRYNQLMDTYHGKLLECAVLENRVKYENEFVLDEEVQMRVLRKKIEDSGVRLKAIKTINSTYQKMIQILRHDANYYEPMLRALGDDIEDQNQFIKHILFLGMPAIAKFKDLSEDYRLMEEKARKDVKAKLKWVAMYKESEKKQLNTTADRNESQPIDYEGQRKHYVRDTKSMQQLRTELQKIEDTINHVKLVTLCPKAIEIYPRIKDQDDDNKKLRKKIENDILGHQAAETKRTRAEILETVLIHNLSEEETKRLDRIKQLQDLIRKEDEFEAATIAHIKNRADSYVLLRYSLSNLYSILKHVDRNPNVKKSEYPNSYLKLPLLKYEMLSMRAYPPDMYEENLENLMALLKYKVQKLMRAYTKEVGKSEMQKHKNEYHKIFLEIREPMDIAGKTEEKKLSDDEEEIDSKTMRNVPNRKQIKAQSAKIVEEYFKKDE